jgi:polyhydroxyalkanoate synthesis repressor PhaR
MLIPVKRYLNRKLYNTLTKRYITLEEIGELIRSGEDVAVTDSTSGEDITTFVLSQVIMGQEKKGERKLSQGLLAGLIRAHSDTLEAVGQLLHLSPDWPGFLHAAGVPTCEDIIELTDQIKCLTQEIDELTRNDHEIGGK